MRMLSEPPPPGTDIAAALRGVGANLEEGGEQRGKASSIFLTIIAYFSDDASLLYAESFKDHTRIFIDKRPL